MTSLLSRLSGKAPPESSDPPVTPIAPAATVTIADLPGLDGLEPLPAPHDMDLKVMELRTNLRTVTETADSHRRSHAVIDAQLVSRFQSAQARHLAGDLPADTMEQARALLESHRAGAGAMDVTAQRRIAEEALHFAKERRRRSVNEANAARLEDALGRYRVVTRVVVALRRALQVAEERQRALANKAQGLYINAPDEQWSLGQRFSRIRDEVAAERPTGEAA